MKKERMLWDKDNLHCVKASKLRDIVIYPDRNYRNYLGESKSHAEVKGWFNDNEYFDFGWFYTTEQAKTFVDNINTRIENT